MTHIDQLSETEKAEVVMSVQMETRRMGLQQTAWYLKKKNEAAKRILDSKRTPTNHAPTNQAGITVYPGIVHTSVGHAFHFASAPPPTPPARLEGSAIPLGAY